MEHEFSNTWGDMFSSRFNVVKKTCKGRPRSTKPTHNLFTAVQAAARNALKLCWRLGKNPGRGSKATVFDGVKVKDFRPDEPSLTIPQIVSIRKVKKVRSGQSLKSSFFE